MTKTAALLLLLPLAASAQSLESLRASADLGLSQAAALAVHPDLHRRREPVLQKPLRPQPMHQDRGLAEIGRVSLAGIAEANRHVMAKQFGARALDLGVGTDAAFSKYYLTFTDAKSTVLGALGDLNRLRGEGVNVRIDPATVYNFKVSINIFSPVRGSTFKMTPVQGTGGPQNDVKTGALLDAIRAKSYVFKAGGRELWLFYGADVKPDGSGYADTRSFLFIKEDGLSSKAWPLAESALGLDAAGSVDLGGIKLSLTRTSSGELIIRQ